jgi:hypothetical protein
MSTTFCHAIGYRHSGEAGSKIITGILLNNYPGIVHRNVFVINFPIFCGQYQPSGVSLLKFSMLSFTTPRGYTAQTVTNPCGL